MAWGRNRNRAGKVEFEQALRRSLRAAVEGDSARAQTWLERAVELDSSDFDAYQALARVYRDRGEVGRAIRMHQNLLLRTDLEPDELAQAKLELARDFEVGGFRERALTTLEELLGERPRDPEVIETMALALIEHGDPTRGDALVARLRRLDPERARRVAARAESGGGEERREGAGRGGIVSRFVARFGARRREESVECALASRLERDGEDHDARVRLARLELDRGQPERARELLARGLERSPEAWRLHVEQGRLWLASGLEAEALKAYASLIEALDAALSRRSAGRSDPLAEAREDRS